MTKTIHIEGMMCAHCEATVKKALEALDGVASAAVSHEAGTAVVTLSAPVDRCRADRSRAGQGLHRDRHRRMSAAPERRHWRFTGQVQGVGFRYRAQYAAQRLGLTGWVGKQLGRQRGDGSPGPARTAGPPWCPP